jgi:hypothetical protein
MAPRRGRVVHQFFVRDRFLLQGLWTSGMRSEMTSNLQLTEKIKVCSKGSGPQAIKSPNRPQKTEQAKHQHQTQHQDREGVACAHFSSFSSCQCRRFTLEALPHLLVRKVRNFHGRLALPLLVLASNQKKRARCGRALGCFTSFVREHEFLICIIRM